MASDERVSRRRQLGDKGKAEEGDPRARLRARHEVLSPGVPPRVAVAEALGAALASLSFDDAGARGNGGIFPALGVGGWRAALDVLDAAGDVDDGSGGVALAAVFDGHNGDSAAEYCRAHLLGELHARLVEPKARANDAHMADVSDAPNGSGDVVSGDAPAREVAAKALAALIKAKKLTDECAEQIRRGESERA